MNRAQGAVAALTCLAAVCLVGCGSDFDDRGRIPNRAPVVTKDSLSWNPPGVKVRLGVPYTYSVRASDPDVGDVIARYEWLFVNLATGWSASRVTAVPSLACTLDAAYVAAEDGASVATVMIRATDNKGAVGQYEVFTIPVAPSELDDPDDPSEPR